MKITLKLLVLTLALIMPITLIGRGRGSCCGRSHGGYWGGGVGISWGYGPIAYSNPWYLSYGPPPMYGYGWGW